MNAWTFEIGVDYQEHNNDREGYLAELNAELQRHGTGMVAATGHVRSGARKLPAGDYMFFARRRNVHDHTKEERVLNLCIERKTVTDVDRSIMQASKERKGLQQMEVQLRQLHCNGIPRTVLLFEGDEDTADFYHDAPDSCRKRFKTFRRNAKKQVYYPGMEVVRMRNKNETLRYLAEQLVELKTQFLRDPGSVTIDHTFQGICNNVKRAISDPILEDYLGRINRKGLDQSRP